MTEFALPAGYLLRRLERWDGLMEMLAHTEAAAASGELALGVPWQRQIRQWRAEAMANGSVELELPGSESPIDGEQLAAGRSRPSRPTARIRRRRPTIRAADDLLARVRDEAMTASEGPDAQQRRSLRNW